ncbi:MAG: hypothetical protein CMH78_05435, partial [Nitrospinae bacterium]|nr:hypothetical protein [Nitrospinota bacterium]
MAVTPWPLSVLRVLLEKKIMRALYFKKKLCYCTGYPMPKPKCNEALIRVTMAGICNTDIE